MATYKKTNYFSNLIYDGMLKGQVPARSESAIKWFRNKGKQAKDFDEKEIYRDYPRRKGRYSLGKMYLFKYDPKHKATLPYYDTTPLIFPIQRYKGKYLGLNFHYLPYLERGVLLDALYDITNNKTYDDTTKLKATYSLLSGSMKYANFIPTIKMYLNSHRKGAFFLIHPIEWDIALFLPLAKFKKATEKKVWADSRKLIRKYKKG